jgi:hypothetical protein
MACPDGTVAVQKHCRIASPSSSSPSTEKKEIQAYLDSTAELDLPLRTLKDREIAQKEETRGVDRKSRIISILLWKIETEVSSKDFIVYAMSRMKKMRRSVPDIHERYDKIVSEADKTVFDPVMRENPHMKRLIMKLALELF